MPLRNGLAIILLNLIALNSKGQTQFRPLPPLVIDRRMDRAYMDSLARLAKQQYQAITIQPATSRNDSIRFEALNYLGWLYRGWESRQDSALYFARQLTQQARSRRNVAFEVKGLLLSESYYHTIRIDFPEALRLNYQARAVLQKAKQDFMLHWRIDLNLGEIYGRSGDYKNALEFLKSAQMRITKGSGMSPQSTIGYQASIEQKIGTIYNRQNNFPDSEVHYLAAGALLEKSLSETGRAYIYDDLGELYLKYGKHQQALHFSEQARAIWKRIKPDNESNSLGTLALMYVALGRDEQALEYAEKILRSPKSTIYTRRKAYITLYQVAEHRQDWQNAAFYYKKYIAVRDTITNEQRGRELAAIQKQNELELLTLENQQAQQLQTERLLTIEKQAELNQFRADAQADALTKKAQLSEQQRRFDTKQASMREGILLSRQRTIQQAQQQALRQITLQQENQSQRTLIAYLASSSLFIVGILILLLYASQLRKRQAEADLRLTRERKDANTRIIQTQETERQRIAADLHDDLGGTLATLRRRLADISLHTTDVDTQRAFAEAEPLIQKSSDDLRRISHNLMPPEFVRIGLRHAIEQLVRHQPLQPTNFSFVTSGIDQKLPIDVELNAYRIVSELVQNINKHAQANRAAVQLLYQPDRLTITVEDDGLGNRAVANVTKSAGIGLKNSSLRAEYIGATLWRDVSEAGTLVVLDIPYPTPLYAARTSLPHSLN